MPVGDPGLADVPAEKHGLTRGRPAGREVEQPAVEVFDLGAELADRLDALRDRGRSGVRLRFEPLDPRRIQPAPVAGYGTADRHERGARLPRRLPLLDHPLGERAYRLERLRCLLVREVLHSRLSWWLDR